jgi:hypothetical protein
MNGKCDLLSKKLSAINLAAKGKQLSNGIGHVSSFVQNPNLLKAEYAHLWSKSAELLAKMLKTFEAEVNEITYQISDIFGYDLNANNSRISGIPKPIYTQPKPNPNARGVPANPGLLSKSEPHFLRSTTLLDDDHENNPRPDSQPTPPDTAPTYVNLQNSDYAGFNQPANHDPQPQANSKPESTVNLEESLFLESRVAEDQTVEDSREKSIPLSKLSDSELSTMHSMTSTKLKIDSAYCQRNMRTYTASKDRFELERISTIQHPADGARPEARSYFAQIREKDPALGDVIFQVNSATSKSDFSYQSQASTRISFIRALKHSEAMTEKENSLIIIAYSKPADLKKISVASISTTKRMLKPLFQLGSFSPELTPNMIQIRQFPEHPSEFELLLLVEGNKVLYSRNRCEDDWFKKLADSHRICLLDRQATHQKLSLAFDTARRSDTRFLLFSRNGEQHHLQLFRTTADQPSIAPEFSFDFEMRDLLQSADRDWTGQLTTGFFDSDVGVTGMMGMFEQGKGAEMRRQVQLVLLDSPQLVPTGPRDHRNLKLFDLSAESAHEADIQKLTIIKSEVIVHATDVDFVPNIRHSQVSFIHKNKSYYLMIYGVTGTNKIFVLLTDSNRPTGGLNCMSQWIELGPEPKAKKPTKSSRWTPYLSSIGDSISITETSKKITATVTVAYDYATSFDAEIDLTHFIKVI